MGCSEDPSNKYYSSYRHILIDSDLKKLFDKEPVYLISTESIPNFIKIIENSNILKYKNDSNYKTLGIIIKNLMKSFDDYKLEKNIKIYNDFTQCKDLAGGSNEKMNEFIIVDEKFLYIMKIINYLNDKVLIKWNKKKDRKIIYFPKEKLNLAFENKRKGIYEFKIIEDENKIINNEKEEIEENNLDISYENGKNVIIKKKLNKNNNNNPISHFQNKKEIKKNKFEPINNKNENDNSINQSIVEINQINNQDNEIFNQFYKNQRKNIVKSNKIEIDKKLINVDNNEIENNMNLNNNMNNNNDLNFNNNHLDINNNNFHNAINSNNNMNQNINFNNMNNNMMNNIPNLNNFGTNLNIANIENGMNFGNKMMMNNMTPNMNNNIINNSNMNGNFNIDNINNMNNNQLFNCQQQPPINFNNNFGNIINIFSNNNQQFINNNIPINNNNQMINNIQGNMNNNGQNIPNISSNNINNQSIQVEIKPIGNIKQLYLNEISKFREPPLIGLANIGATCYMNATLQCLSNINFLTDYFLSNKNTFLNIPFNSQDKPISKAFSDVLYHLWDITHLIILKM